MNENNDEKYGRKLSPYEPDWEKWDIRDYPVDKTLYVSSKTNIENGRPIQQNDLLKPLYMDIVKFGLNYAFQKWKLGPDAEKEADKHKETSTKNPKHVIIVGAGMAGLVAAYELGQVGHKVTVLEQDTRFGGRVYTVREEHGLAKGLFGEAGAMRIPCSEKEPIEKMTHFLTDFYADKFQLGLKQFVNSCENGYYKFYNEPVTKASDWENKTFDELWPGWNKTLKENSIKDIDSIGEYFEKTVGCVMEHLHHLMLSENEVDAWNTWIDIWSQFALDGFLQSSYDVVKLKVPPTNWVDTLDELKKYLPWPDAALTAYSTFNYTPELNQSLVQYLRDELGQWWSPTMHRIDGGTGRLPEMFTKRNKKGWNKKVHLSKNIHFNHRVNDIVYTFDDRYPDYNHVMVQGYHTTSGLPFTAFEGDAVIVTPPINAIRQITFKPSKKGALEPPIKFYNALEDISTRPSTKIFLQTKTRFWEKEHIKGGFSKTNLPIGQIHYPSNEDGDLPGEKGVLLIYTWKSEAILFGALPPAIALKEAVEQVAVIHPEIVDEFETGYVHAWNNQASSQGAFVLLDPKQFQNVQWLRKPMFNVHFAGDGTSTASGWMQGALESGLRAAYQFYVHNEECLDNIA